MNKILRLSARNVTRYWRRSLLTSSLIVLGMVAVLSFVAVSASFKNIMIGQITDSMLGHLQVHKRGYVASLENLPLNLNLAPKQLQEVEQVLAGMDEVAAVTPRLKFGAMFSNFVETTSIRLNGVLPEREMAAMPLLAGRMVEGETAGLLAPGELLIPQLLARGMKVEVGDTVVLVATNVDGSVNGRTFVVRGILEAVTGPGGRDGYLHMDDARELLRLEQAEINEIALRLHEPERLELVKTRLEQALATMRTPAGMSLLEVHGWDQLAPFANIVRMIDLLDLFIRVMLVGIVLIAVMNVMLMAVYERVREIGTIAAMGTQPGRIMMLFVGEGVLLAVIGTVVGTLISLTIVQALNIWQVSFAFGRQHVVLAPSLAPGEIFAIGAIVILVAAVASLQPAWKAARMDPITALRHT
ncbi:ABC transporter permease [Desulfurivibrio sp. C05AmB]|uniref:ABC transporter permease n=1 Tax=Desulfurivibrio sp. C05AmB TaxID=3374371 RepID=UPI00376EDE83